MLSGVEDLGSEEVADISGKFRRRKVRASESYLGTEKMGSQIAFVVNEQRDDGDEFDGVLGVRGPKFPQNWI